MSGAAHVGLDVVVGDDGEPVSRVANDDTSQRSPTLPVVCAFLWFVHPFFTKRLQGDAECVFFTIKADETRFPVQTTQTSPLIFVLPLPFGGSIAPHHGEQLDDGNGAVGVLGLVDGLRARWEVGWDVGSVLPSDKNEAMNQWKLFFLGHAG